MLPKGATSRILRLIKALEHQQVSPHFVRKFEAIPLTAFADPDLWLAAGRFLKELGNYAASVAVYECATEIHAKSEKIWTSYAILLLDWGRLQEALDACDRALGLCPNEPRALSTKGRVHELLHNYHDALKFYSSAREVSPTDPLLPTNMGCCHLALGDEVQARDYFEKALEIDKSYTNALFNLASLDIENEQYKRALSRLKQLRAQLPEDEEVARMQTLCITKTK